MTVLYSLRSSKTSIRSLRTSPERPDKGNTERRCQVHISDDSRHCHDHGRGLQTVSVYGCR